MIKPIQELIESLKLQMMHRFDDIESNILLSEANILDPRFKKNGFNDIRNFEIAASNLKLKLSTRSHHRDHASYSRVRRDTIKNWIHLGRF